ncbi:hypothetical protein QR77_17425 [Streptomyces sp. 150FB]|uniref:FG-GAP and VCBS repeat-containing protein n=1 Tax=Streptomyces sp. 150FB TaxID=1576605 RepID=UPI0005895348|nr:FG-GAP and VCBS repeat-containing protein [Streptomyces sp. 150FB]KIF75227.1 hypothetical protein QR77_17425 [Streptomyces sp. 150FB]
MGTSAKRLTIGTVLLLPALLAGLTACSAPEAPEGSHDGPPASTAHSPRPAPAAPAHPGVRSDFNGDGLPDLVVTDTSATIDGVHASGYMAVLPGSAEGPDTTRHQIITQNSLGLGKAGQAAGFGLHAVTGDLDGDGYADLVTQAGSNAVFVVWGGRDKLSGGARLTGTAPFTGDFDGDGKTDLVAMVKRSGVPEEPSGAVISYGPLSRSGEPSRTAKLDLTPDNRAQFYSAAVTGVGDVTGDGKDDLVVTLSHIFSDEEPVPQATVLYPGTASGVPAEGAWLKDARGEDLYGDNTLTTDVDKDGYADVVIGLPCARSGEADFTPEGGGRIAVSYGGRAGMSTTRKPTTINDRTPGMPKGLASAETAYCAFGWTPSVGDVNGDGYGDVAFGAALKTAGVAADARYTELVLRGGAKGLTADGVQQIPGADGFGTAAAVRTTQLDTNGDGADELVLSAGSQSPSDRNVRILSGSPAGLDTAHPAFFGRGALGQRSAPGDAFGSNFAH